MRRVDLFEFTDMAWYPRTFRRIQTDYLHFVATRGTGQRNLVPLIARGLRQAGTTEIVDLCSGGTGPWLRLQEHLGQAGWRVCVKLTDKYPDPQAVQKWPEGTREGIEYLAEPVDATQVPRHLTGMRTLFEGVHHFGPQQARSILKDAAERGSAIGIFEASLKPPLGPLVLLLSPLMTLAAYFLLTPFIRPRTLPRLLWTYLLPVVPLATCWDGVVSLLRVYSQRELQALTASIECEGYAWEAGQVSTGTPIMDYTYLLGYPSRTSLRGEA